MENNDHIFISKKGNKLIRNGDFVLRMYRKVPTNILFKSKMVNDHNQDLCGGWSIRKHSECEEIDRVYNGLKPLGVSFMRGIDNVKNKIKEIEEKGFLSSYCKSVHCDIYMITASIKGKLKDYFDMELLAKDYENNGLSNKAIKNILKRILIVSWIINLMLNIIPLKSLD